MFNRNLTVLLLAANLILPVFSFAETDKEVAAKEFAELNADFQDEISYPPYSDYVYKNKYWMSASGKKIIAMGKRAIPFIMDELKSGNYWYSTALDYITGVRMSGTTGDNLAGNWLDWWDENKDNPEWNVFLNSSSSNPPGGS
jgi:hypothetical protein